MPNCNSKVILTTFCLLLLIPAAPSASVVHIADGDTITVLRDGEDVRIRLYGIDTPESDQPFSRAERFTDKTIGDNRVEIVPKDRDRCGRTVALVYIEGDGEC